MGHHFLIFPARFVLVITFDPAHSSRVQPVVRPHSDSHQAESGESAHCSDEHLDSSVTHQHFASFQDGGRNKMLGVSRKASS